VNLPIDPALRVVARRQFRQEDDLTVLMADELRRFLSGARELTPDRTR
jgi:hypothetical protein